MKADVIILGGGPNGLAAALALGGAKLPRPLEVLLLDARDPRALPEDSRGTAVTQATQAMFKALAVWDLIEPHAAEMRDVIVTDASGTHEGRPTLLSFATDGSSKAAAAMVENQHLIRALLTAVEASPNITLRGGFAFSVFESGTARITVRSSSGESCDASLLIAADGRNSAVRTQMNVKLTQQDYHQTALSFAVTHTEPHDNLAEEHFSPDGVFAVLPLPGLASSIVWGTSPENANQLMAMVEGEFNEALRARMGTRLGAVSLKGKRAAYPLQMQIADTFIGPRIALLGDAAHAIHPLAGLGLNLGFKDAAALADCVMQARARGEDIGGIAVLERYQSARRFDTLATSLAMDGMNALFVNDNPVLKVMRDAGLRLVDQISQLKAAMMGHAAGTSQDSPRLLRGLLPG
jgi:2-octaprenyl-6-methoxyphenol hydroxylase